MKRMLVAAVVLIVGLAFVVTAASAASVENALAVLPRSLSDLLFLFTDWAQIKTQLGLDGVTSDSPLDARMDLARRSTQDLAVSTAYGLADVETHAAMWGWDLADLEWEISLLSAEMPTIYVLKLRDGFDFSRISAHFVEYGFDPAESHGIPVFHHDFDPSQDWTRSTELAIHTTAYVEAGSLMILSSSPVAIEMCLSALSGETASLSEDAYLLSALAHLGDADSGIILRDLGTCVRFTPNPILDLVGTLPSSEQVDELKAAMEHRDLLVPYRALGVGYENGDGNQVGTLTFEYDTADLAALDMPARQVLAEEGMSLYGEAPISETYFTVQGCEVRDNAVVMTVAPVGDNPGQLFRMIFYVDAVFAGCSS